MALAGAIAIFVECDIQHPVQVVFDRPMRAYCLRQTVRIVGGQAGNEVTRLRAPARGVFLAAGNGEDAVQSRPAMTFAQLGNVVGCGNSPGFQATVFGIDAKRHGLGCQRRLKVGFDILQQTPLIAFQAQHVVAALANDLFGDFLLTTHGIDGDDGAGNIQALQELGNGGDFVGFVVDFHLPQHQAIVLGPRAHQVDGGFFRRMIHAAAQTLTVDGDDFAVTQCRQISHPAGKAFAELALIDGREHRAEGIMRGNSVGQIQLFAKPIGFGPAIFFDLDPVVGTTNHPAQRDDENILEPMLFLAIDTRIGDAGKMMEDGSARRGHL